MTTISKDEDPMNVAGVVLPDVPRIRSDEEQTVLMLLDIQENAWLANGQRRFKGYAQLQRIIEYLILRD